MHVDNLIASSSNQHYVASICAYVPVAHVESSASGFLCVCLCESTSRSVQRGAVQEQSCSLLTAIERLLYTQATAMCVAFCEDNKFRILLAVRLLCCLSFLAGHSNMHRFEKNNISLFRWNSPSSLSLRSHRPRQSALLSSRTAPYSWTQQSMLSSQCRVSHTE